MNAKRIARWFLLLGVLAGVGYLVYGKISRGQKKKAQITRQSSGPKELLVDGYVVKTSKLSNTLDASGTLQSNEVTNIQAEISARVTGIYFREGKSVSKGAVLVKLYDGDQLAQLQKLKTQKLLAETTLQRQKYLLSRGGVSQQETDVAASQVESIDADIALTESQLQRTQIRAPFSGVVGLRNVSVGTVVSPTTIIASIQQTNPLKLDFSIPEKYTEALKVGDAVQFTVASDRTTHRGTVYAIEPQVDPTTRTIRLRARVPNPNYALSPGQFAKVRLELSSTPEALMIPSQAVIPGAREKKVAIARNGKAAFVTVETGVREASTVQILSGIQPGDTLIISGMMQLKPNAAIKIVRMQKQAVVVAQGGTR
ncbi:MAG: efflux RND transporter periplasmic adaptor subunit [Cytophagaceae bacterium]|nr:efflux RND transporter periplasmic adaptor subunit [Cytophagaceae bacterium]